jgi:hypothetical protein
MARVWLAAHHPLDFAAFYRDAVAKRESALSCPQSWDSQRSVGPTTPLTWFF